MIQLPPNLPRQTRRVRRSTVQEGEGSAYRRGAEARGSGTQGGAGSQCKSQGGPGNRVPPAPPPEPNQMNSPSPLAPPAPVTLIGAPRGVFHPNKRERDKQIQRQEGQLQRAGREEPGLRFDVGKGWWKTERGARPQQPANAAKLGALWLDAFQKSDGELGLFDGRFGPRFFATQVISREVLPVRLPPHCMPTRVRGAFRAPLGEGATRSLLDRS